ncbi:cytidylate kinase [Candidatus Woesearchaeota archaeon]|nr:MAG: cytidylate kinase [Candidatus Woesearchaeota archaeon ex4484_78]RLE45992.1 MAG: cytidylate kinase [Candidatus Woesearchaeota archaeon]
MIITISGTPGSGKSTVAKGIAERLGYEHFSAGDFMRKLAEEKNTSLQELMKKAEKNKTIDKMIDEQTKKLAKEKDDFVIDSRLAFHFIPESIKIFLKTDELVAAKRILRDIMRNKRKTESEIKTLKDAENLIKKRLESEKKRYKKYYGLDYLDEENYDFVLDTTGLVPEEAIDKVMNFIINKISE